MALSSPTVTNLVSDAQAKWPSKKLAQLTNPESSTNSTNTTVLTKAAEDAATYFNQKSAKEYNDENPLHRQVALVGVELFLKEYIRGASKEVEALYRTYDKKLEDVDKARTFRMKTGSKTEDEDVDVLGKSYYDNLRLN